MRHVQGQSLAMSLLAAFVIAAPAAADTWQTIQLASPHVTFQIPKSWSDVVRKPELETFPKDKSVFLRILTEKTGISVDAIGKGFAASELTDLRKSDPKATVTTAHVTLPVGPASRVTMRYRGQFVNHVASITRVIYFFKKGSLAYDFDFGAAEAYSKNRAVFDRVIKSVRVPSAAKA